ncbi:MAG: RNA methyltransferase [Pseudomonadota bacterium]
MDDEPEHAVGSEASQIGPESGSETIVRCAERDGWRVPTVCGPPPDGDQILGDLVFKLRDVPVSRLEEGDFGAVLNHDELDAALVYCAERRCEADHVTCPGCRMRAKQLGHHSIQDFIADHAEIRLTREVAVINGSGSSKRTFADMDAFTQGWSGRETWYLARRVLRKLRHGLPKTGQNINPLAGVGETPAIILVEPQLADNIGMVARAMGNFGLDDLRLVAPRDGWPNEKARVAAAGANFIIDAGSSHGAVTNAVGDLQWVCATTARQRHLRKPVMTPQQAAEEMSRRIASGQRCGVLFGRESSGLSSDELAEADALVMIPVDSRFASLNLAQAVLLMGYAFMLTTDRYSLGRVTSLEKPISEGLKIGKDVPATKAELVGLFEHLEAALDDAEFFAPQHRRPSVVKNLRTMLTRMTLTSQEVRTWRGIVATLRRGSAKGS